MSAITLRPAEAGDIPAITGIYTHAVLHGTATFEIDPPDETEMAQRFTALTSKNYPYLVACDHHGAVIGYAYAGPFRARPAYRWSVEDSIYLAPEAQGKGAGRALLQRLLDETTTLGFRQMVAVIGGGDHQPSLRVHAGAGFRMVGTFEASGFKFGRWIDTVIMQRQLGQGRESLPDEAAYPGTMR